MKHKFFALPMALLACTAALAGGSPERYRDYDQRGYDQRGWDQARVTRSIPQYALVPVRQEFCTQAYAAPRFDGAPQHSYGGAILGTVIGGVVGSRFGGGDGRLAATAIGAGIGALVGNTAENQYSQGYATSVPVRQCRTEVTYQNQLTGYLVDYEYRGLRHTTLMDHDPGSSIPVGPPGMARY